MDDETRRKLETIETLVHENRRMLRAMRRSRRIGLVERIIIWLLVFLVPFYIYKVYVKPLINDLTGSSPTATSTDGGSGFLGLPSSAELKNLIHSYQSGQKP